MSLALLTLITGCAYPLALFAIGQALFPTQAAGSPVTHKNTVVGSRLIGQNFAQPKYFHPRPSAAGAGYDTTASGGTNLAPSNPKLVEDVRRLVRAYRAENGLAPDATVPVDAVTRSGSGLDPHISTDDAALQVRRVAQAHGLDERQVRRLVAEHTQGRQLGFLGQPRVTVLDLNLALERLTPSTP